MNGLREQLRAIYDERGELTAALVVDTARPEDHPLHNRFEWDDRIAGEAYRHAQAAALIRSLRVKERPAAPDYDIREYVSVKRDDAYSCNYEPVEDVLADDLKRHMLLRDMERDARVFHRRWSHMKEFAALLDQWRQGGEAS